jgi:replication factor C large subunit
MSQKKPAKRAAKKAKTKAGKQGASAIEKEPPIENEATITTIDIPWVEKYRPRTAKDAVGIDAKKKALEKFLKEFPKTRAAVLIGPPGVGKTTLAYAVARDQNRDIIELNASDARSTDEIRRRIGESTKSKSLTDFIDSISMKGKIILVDELDGISGNDDRGGIQTLHDLIQKTEFPIIMTCNDWLSKLKPIYDVAQMIKFTSVKKESIRAVLERIVQAEHLEGIIPPETIELLAENAGGDFRSAINDLQAIATGRVSIPAGDLGHTIVEEAETAVATPTRTRDEFISAYEGVTKAFGQKKISAIRRIVDQIDLPNAKSSFEYDTILAFFLQNFHKVTNDYSAIAAGATMLADADRTLGFIRENQDWSLLGYFFDYIAAAIVIVTLSTKKETFSQKVDQPAFRFAKGSSPIEMIEMIGTTLDASIDDVKREILPVLKELLDADKDEFKDEFLAWLAVDTPAKKKITNWLAK